MVSFSSDISDCSLEFSVFRVDISISSLMFCCFNSSFSFVNHCICWDSVSPGNGSGTGTGFGILIGSGVGSGICGGSGSCSDSNASINCKGLAKRSIADKPKITIIFIFVSQ